MNELVTAVPSRASSLTRERILTVALSVFNAQGTAVSLALVARSAGLSTGNLQYHFRTVEVLIFELVEALFRRFDDLYPAEGLDLSLERLRTGLEAGLRLQWDYRFFFREQGALLRKDPRLALRFADLQRRRLDRQSALLQSSLRSAGRVVDEAELAHVVLGGWVLTQAVLTHLEALGTSIDDSAVQHATDIVLAHFGPYLTHRREA